VVVQRSHALLVAPQSSTGEAPWPLAWKQNVEIRKVVAIKIKSAPGGGFVLATRANQAAIELRRRAAALEERAGAVRRRIGAIEADLSAWALFARCVSNDGVTQRPGKAKAWS